MRRVVLFLPLLLTSLRAEDPAPTFPKSWEGVWKGACVLVRGGKTAMEFPMELHVEKREGHWTWKVVYGAGAQRQVRPYELRATGENWVIDEKNGIVIDSYFENGRLHSRFDVMESSIQATYRRRGDELDVSLVTFDAKPVRRSGGQDRIPKVAAYELRAVQRGTLKR